MVWGANPHALGDPREKSHTAEAIRAWLVSKLSEELGIPAHEIDVREPFASYGLDSVRAVSLSGELEELVGRQLSPTLLYDYPSIEILTRYLVGESAPAASSSDIAGEPRSKPEPIAIIGIGCRFPGASDPEAFWRLLCNGVDAITEVPADRWDLRAFYDPDPSVPGKMNTRWGGFLQRIDEFDSRFFGISPREAARTDPQQRLLLEVAWEALEDAGQVLERLAGTPTGVFIGISTNEYGQIQLGDARLIDAYAGTGNALSIAANRISYVFDFRGPSLAVDTACSSSLAAVHLACQSLLNGEGTLALAGGVNLILSPALTINFTKAGAMAPDGRCKAFDGRANGYVRSEGAGLVVLKPLSRALADGDAIHAVIRGSALNQDGRTNGLMAPSRQAQEAVLREAYRRAGVSPGQVRYVEAHGTGTFVGDPIEAGALARVLAVDRPPGRPCAIGSVKTNIGHLEAAAGVAGLIKVALSLKYRAIPPSLHFQEPNPHIPFDELPLRVQQELTPWPEDSVPALAGVSSFGFGGTNVHVVVEESPRRLAPPSDAPGAYLLPLSARSEAALRSLARAYRDFAATEGSRSGVSFQDVCYTASVRRTHHDHRLALAVSSWEELVERLDAFLGGQVRPGVTAGYKRPGHRRKVVFVFPGQGSQWLGMGRDVAAQEPVFRAALERCDQAIRQEADWSLLGELMADASGSRLDEIDVVQPALFAIQVALVALWRSWGIEADAVVGHSLGEVAAAHVAGALSLEDAVRVICRRSRLLKRVSERGGMAAVELSVEQVRRAVAGYEDRLAIAASNSPTSTVLSGDLAALQSVIDRLQRHDVYCRMIKVDVASHSPQMDALRAELLHILDGLAPRRAATPIYSTVVSKVIDGSELGAPYWVRNLREPVLFSAAVQALLENGHEVFVELSPHPILLSAVQQGLDHLGRDGFLLPSLRRGEEWTVLLGSLGALYALGHELNWSRLYPAGGCVRLPSYPWQRERCWLETAASGTPAWRDGSGAPGSDLRGRHLESAHPPGRHLWQIDLDPQRLPHIADHRIHGTPVLPASGYAEMARAAAAQALGTEPRGVAELEFHRALFLPAGGARTVQVVLAPDAEGGAAFHIYSRAKAEGQPPESWILHASGKICADPELGALRDREQPAPEEIRARCLEAISGDAYYRRLREQGVEYGPTFQTIQRLWQDDGEALAEVRLPEAGAAGGDQLHPAILESGLQILGAALLRDARPGGGGELYLPTRITRVRVSGFSGRRLWGHARLRSDATRGEADPEGTVRLLDEAGGVILEMLIRFRRLGRDVPRGAPVDVEDWLYELQWQRKARPASRGLADGASASRGTWLILADRNGIADELAAFLAARGERYVLVSSGDAFERVDGGRFRIHPARKDDVRRLLEAMAGPDQPACRGVIHLWSLHSAPPAELTVAALETAQTLGCRSVLSLLQELTQLGSRQGPALWLVTRGAQRVAEEPGPFNVAQAPVWGFGRVIAEEHPALWGGLVDLDPRSSAPEAAARLGTEVLNPDHDRQLAFRDGQRYVARLVRRRKSAGPPSPLRWRADGTYLITGGLGDLGLEVARWMAEQGARRLILLGRTPLPPRSSWSEVQAGSRLARQVTAIRELEALGACVHLAAVDVANEAQLTEFLETFRREGWPPIRGVVHLAGVLEDRLLEQLDGPALDSVLRPKVVGGWLLHRLFDDASLDFFVLFSSAASLLGQAGQANYAAANAFLDALAHHRGAQGRLALSIAWGAWAELGFAVTPGGRRIATHAAARGIGSIPPRQGLEVLDRLLKYDATHAIVLPVNWPQYRQVYPAGSEPVFLSDLVREETNVTPIAPGQSQTERVTRDAVLAAEPGERHRVVESYVRDHVSRVLGLPPSDVDVHRPLNTLGLDSLMAVQVKNRVEVTLGVTVPVVKFLEGSTVHQLARHVVEQLTAAGPPARTPVPRLANAEELLARLDRLSDDQVDALLRTLLDEEEGTG